MTTAGDTFRALADLFDQPEVLAHVWSSFAMFQRTMTLVLIWKVGSNGYGCESS